MNTADVVSRVARWFAPPLLVAVTTGCAALPVLGNREQPVKFPGKDVTLAGILFTSAAAYPGERRPAVVLMHGCSGMLNSRGRLPAGRREWTEQFVRWGYVALQVDSFGPRNLGSVCDLKDRPPESHPWNVRTADAFAALDFLAARSDVDPQQIFVLGWSHGGATVMGLVRPEAIGRRDDGPRFKAAIAFYPGCMRPLQMKDYRTTMPLLILHGEDDDWTPAAPCVELAKKITTAHTANGAQTPFPLRTVTYPGARHGFDSIATPVRLLPNVYNGMSPTGRGAWVGGHEPSRLKAVDETKRFVDSLRRRPAPDEEKLGKLSGYPVGAAGNWYTDESVRVGSLTHQAEIPGLYRGKVNVLQPSDRPMRLARATREPDYRWSVADARDLTVDDFMARQRIMGLLIVKDGVIQVERYQYDRQPSDRFTSQSMAKSITALAVGFALNEGRIASLDDRADRYAAGLRGTVYGATTIRNLLRMASGARYRQTYDGTGDTPRFAAAIARDGIEGATRMVTERDTPQGTRFYYASPHTTVLAAVLRGAVGTSLSDYLTPRLWQPIGAEQTALWWADKTGLEVALGNFNATLRDYARLGVVLANDGARPDDPAARQIIPWVMQHYAAPLAGSAVTPAVAAASSARR